MFLPSFYKNIKATKIFLKYNINHITFVYLLLLKIYLFKVSVTTDLLKCETNLILFALRAKAKLCNKGKVEEFNFGRITCFE